MTSYAEKVRFIKTKARSILLEEKDLREYIQRHWRGFETKDYEILVAMLLARFHEKQFGSAFHIGFPVKANVDRVVRNEYSTENIDRILQSFIDEDTSIDIFLVPAKNIDPWPTAGTRRVKADGQAFQLKRLAVKEDGDLTSVILNFVSNDVPRAYSPIQATLVLVLGGEKTSGTFDIKKISEGFMPQKFPFARVMFVTGNNEKLILGELWPNHGYTEYSPDELF